MYRYCIGSAWNNVGTKKVGINDDFVKLQMMPPYVK